MNMFMRNLIKKDDEETKQEEEEPYEQAMV